MFRANPRRRPLCSLVFETAMMELYQRERRATVSFRRVHADKVEFDEISTFP